MNALTITPAALHAALVELRDRGAERDDDRDAAAFLIDGLNVLEALFDPAHQPQALHLQLDPMKGVMLAAEAATELRGWRREPTEDIGSAMDAPPTRTPGAAGAQEQATMPVATAAAANRPDPANAGTPAPPTIELPAGPGCAAETVTPTPAPVSVPYDTGSATAPAPAQAATGHPHPNAPGKWTAERIKILRADLPTCTDRPALLARINERPGEPIASVKAMMVKAANLGIKAEAWASRAIEAAAGRRGGAASIQAAPVTAPPTATRMPERMEAFPALWQDPSLTVSDIHRQLNAMPGDPIKTSTSLYGFAKRLGLSTHRPMLDESLRPEPAEAARQARATRSAPAHDDEEPAPEPWQEPEQHAPHDAEPKPADDAPAPNPEPRAEDPPARALHPRNPRAGAALPAVPDDKAEAFEAFENGMTVRDVAADFGLPLSTLSNWHAEWRLARRKDPSA